MATSIQQYISDYEIIGNNMKLKITNHIVSDCWDYNFAVSLGLNIVANGNSNSIEHFHNPFLIYGSGNSIDSWFVWEYIFDLSILGNLSSLWVSPQLKFKESTRPDTELVNTGEPFELTGIVINLTYKSLSFNELLLQVDSENKLTVSGSILYYFESYYDFPVYVRFNIYSNGKEYNKDFTVTSKDSGVYDLAGLVSAWSLGVNSSDIVLTIYLSYLLEVDGAFNFVHYTNKNNYSQPVLIDLNCSAILFKPEKDYFDIELYIFPIINGNYQNIALLGRKFCFGLYDLDNVLLAKLYPETLAIGNYSVKIRDYFNLNKVHSLKVESFNGIGLVDSPNVNVYALDGGYLTSLTNCKSKKNTQMKKSDFKKIVEEMVGDVKDVHSHHYENLSNITGKGILMLHSGVLRATNQTVDSTAVFSLNGREIYRETFKNTQLSDIVFDQLTITGGTINCIVFETIKL